MEENEKPRKRRVMIHVKDLRKEYTLEGGELCCIFGTSGSGKSTLLNQLAGLEKPTFGDVYIRGVPITRLSENQLAAFRQKHIGFVFQSYNLLPFMNAVENVAMPLMFRGDGKRDRTRKAVAMLKKVGLGNRMKHYPRQMSGGQQQRVGIARAFVARPDVVFADEPTGNLDSKSGDVVIHTLSHINRELGKTIVMVTHDIAGALPYADKVLHIGPQGYFFGTRREYCASEEGKRMLGTAFREEEEK